MKRIIITIMLALSLIAPVALSASAGAIDLFPKNSPTCTGESAKKQTTVVCQQANKGGAVNRNPVIYALKVTINLMSLIVGVSAVIGFILAGFQMVTSQGDSQNFAKQRSAIIYSSIGLVLVAISQVIVAFVLNKL